MTPVYFEQFLVGKIHVSETGPSFTYEPRWLDTNNAFPVSLTIPIEAGSFGPDIISPWLINLLPEEQNLVTIGKNLGVSPQDSIGLLERIGHDVAGALSIGEPRIKENPDYRLVDDDTALEKIIADLPKKPFLAGEEGVSMSLAGVQEKLPIAVVDGKIAIPINGAPSTHILKPDTERLYGSIHNEALCMTLAQQTGLEAANVTTGTAGKRSYLLVERYDRKLVKDRLIRVHQEDFCQALSKPPAAKYENNRSGIKGPGVAEFFNLVAENMTAADTNKLLNGIIFNILICNTDSHAKNYSILLSGGPPRLAPLYDLMCADAWEGITQNHSQEIAGKNRGSHIHGRHWKRMAAACGLSETMIVERVAELAERIGKEILATAEAVKSLPTGDHPMLSRFVEAIHSRCRSVVANLRD